MEYDFSSFDSKIAAAKEWLTREYRGLRTGRATPAILDGINVSAYGAMSPLKQVANISVEDARSIRVAPYDPSLVKDIERAISAADLGLGIGSDASGVRVMFPELTLERREELIKMAKGKLEESRAAVRVARDEERKIITEEEKEGSISEDERFRSHEEIQKRVDKANGELEEMFAAKQKEMTS